MSLDNTHTTGGARSAPPCWYCQAVAASAQCRCGRPYCNHHGYSSLCMLCALGYGVYEKMREPEPVSGLMQLSLRAAAKDPYIVVPATLQHARPLPVQSVENIVATLVRMLASNDDNVRRRAASVLAVTLTSWPTMDPSPLVKHEHGISLLATDQVRRWLTHTLKNSRLPKYEPIALPILEKLQNADFRDLYPAIQEELRLLKCTPFSVRVREVFDTFSEFYPTHSQLLNERCELIAYAHYFDRKQGVGPILERVYGPLLKYSPILSKMLKKGVWLTSQARYEELYPGQKEPI